MAKTRKPSKKRQVEASLAIIAAIRRALEKLKDKPLTEACAPVFEAELGPRYSVRIGEREISVWGGREEDGNAVYLQWHPRPGKTWQESVDAALKRYEAVLSHDKKR